jgi:hypothetical protein
MDSEPEINPRPFDGMSHPEERRTREGEVEAAEALSIGSPAAYSSAIQPPVADRVHTPTGRAS